MKREGDTKDFIRTTVLLRISAALIVCTVLLLVINTVLYIKSNATARKHYELSYRATQFMNASAYLTSEVRAFAATGDPIHYDNYWNEVNVLKNRDQGIAAMKELGITEEEKNLIEGMSSISDNLIPYEAQAMELAKAGYTKGAMEIVYGAMYNSAIADIRALSESLRTKLDVRIERDMNAITVKYNIVNIITWILAISVIVMQFIQKNILYRLAYIDHLTSSFNYYAFRQKMRSGIHIQQKGYLVAADLKNFGIINDVCGIDKGDKIICEISKVLRSSLSSSSGELLAHISGDRFVMLLQCRDDEELIKRLRAARSNIVKLSEEMDVPYLMPIFGIKKIESSKHPEVSYGAASFAGKLLKNSDKNSFYSFFDQEMQATIFENRLTEENFESALESKQFEVWYQPKYATDTDKCAAAEAVVRWNKDGEMKNPGSFVPLFEHNGMINQLDEFVFDAVCAKQKRWIDGGFEVLPVSVNISRATLLRPNIVEHYTDIIKRYGVPPSCVELELTESAMSLNNNTTEILTQFRKAGISVLVDDFGIGYSSLSTLTYGCFDGIKLDKSLVDDIGTDSGKHLVEILIDLAHEFDMKVTAEGAETAEQVEIIKKLSCDMIQGYFYSRPLEENDFEKLLNSSAER